MAFSFVASTGEALDTAGTTLDTTGSLNVEAGDVLVAWCKHEGAPSSTFEVAGADASQPFTFDAGDKVDHSNGDLSASFGYLIGASADAAFTPRFTTLSRTWRTILVMQFRPDPGETVTKDQANDSQGSGTSIASGTITTTGDDEIAIGGYGEYVGNTSSAHQINGVNATAVVQASTFGPNNSAMWYRILTATFSGGQATCSNASADWIGAILTIKSATASAGPNPDRSNADWFAFS